MQGCFFGTQTGTRTYTITTPAANGGASCSYFNGYVDSTTQSCTDNSGCTPPPADDGGGGGDSGGGWN